MTKSTARRRHVRRSLRPIYELGAFNVPGFCLAHGVSRSLFYSMLRSGVGPRIMKCGTRTLISVESAQRWRRARERVAAVSRPARTDGGHRTRKNHRRRRT